MDTPLARVALLLCIALALAGCSPAAPLNLISGSDAVIEETDLRYGPLPRHRYDLYTPVNDPDAPLVVYVHGGSWYDGSKDIYRFLGTALADEGFAVAIINYRLAPDTLFPGFVDDAARAVDHLLDETPERPVFVMGHSAGAQIAGLVAYDPRYLSAFGRDNCAVAGFVGVSGPYDFLPLREVRFKVAFPEETRPLSQPIAFASGPNPPSLLIHSRDDRTVHVEDTTLMAEALRQNGQPVAVALYDDAGHINIIGAMSRHLRGWAPTFDDTLAFLNAQRAAGFPGCDASM